MGHGDDIVQEIFETKEFIINSEFGSEDYHLAYKKLMSLLKRQTDAEWGYLAPHYHNKQECAFLSLIDYLIYVDEDDPKMGYSADVVAKFLKADIQLLEYCKYQIDADNSCDFKVKRKISVQCKLDLLREAVRLAGH